MSRTLVGFVIVVAAASCGGKQATPTDKPSTRESGWDFDPKTVTSIEITAEEKILCAGGDVSIKVTAIDTSGLRIENGLQTKQADPMSDFGGELPDTVTVKTTPETPPAYCSGATCWVKSPIPKFPGNIGKDIEVSISIPGSPAKPATLTFPQSFDCDARGYAVSSPAKDGKRGADGDDGRGNGDPGQKGEDGGTGGDAEANTVDAAFVSTDGFPKLLLVIGGDVEKPDVMLISPERDAKVYARGGMGGTGGKGGTGGAATGSSACMPGKGGEGVKGGTGGKGGKLTVRTPSKEVYALLRISFGGGTGGFAGDPGKGGDCGEGYTGTEGEKGDKGEDGEDGDLDALTVPVAKRTQITTWLAANPQYKLVK